MERKLNIKVGQEVAVRINDFCNARQRLGKQLTLDNIKDWCFTSTVTKAGKKYITVEFYIGECLNKAQFSVEDDYNEKEKAGGADYKLYESKEDIVKEVKTKALYNNIKDKFGDNFDITAYSIDQLERIMSILNE